MTETKSKVYGLYLPLTFPEGLSAGSGSLYNLLKIARDGTNKPVLRGTALAGAIRHAYCKRFGKEQTNEIFGFATEKKRVPQASRLKVPDTPLDLNQQDVNVRTHHMRCRHTGTVQDGCLFSVEACPPNTHADMVLWLEDDLLNPSTDSEIKSSLLLQWIVALFSEQFGGLSLGGNAARGVGRAVLRDKARWLECDLSDIDKHGEYLDARKKITQRQFDVCREWPVCEPVENADSETLTVQFTLTIPRGQDILIADGRGLDHTMEPQRVTGSDGKRYWRLPGSSLRGMFRNWVLRLAARDGRKIADSQENYKLFSAKDEYNGDSLAWIFMKNLKNNKSKLREIVREEHPVEDLFGTAFQKGKLHIADAYAEISKEWNEENPYCETEQVRMHVKVDPITGGASNTALFDNTVLTSAGNPQFPVVMQVSNPTEEQARWLAVTLKALHMGILRIGSSKSAGIVTIQKQESGKLLNASGKNSEIFTTIFEEE